MDKISTANLRVVVFAVIFASFVEGVYQLITPLYLQGLEISFVNIGFIFSVAAFAMILLKILLGAYPDVRGRKFVFTASFLFQAMSNAVFHS